MGVVAGQGSGRTIGRHLRWFAAPLVVALVATFASVAPARADGPTGTTADDSAPNPFATSYVSADDTPFSGSATTSLERPSTVPQQSRLYGAQWVGPTGGTDVAPAPAPVPPRTTVRR